MTEPHFPHRLSAGIKCIALDVSELCETLNRAADQMRSVSAALQCIALDQLEQAPPLLYGEFG